MTTDTHAAESLFGTNLAALVTPMNLDGTIDDDGVDRLVDSVVTSGCDGLVVCGTTGESPTVTAAEVIRLVQQVRSTADSRARVIVGVGTYDTAESVRRAHDAQDAGADALMVVCPYYSRPTQRGITAHVRSVVDATDLPIMLYDVPKRAGTQFHMDTLVELADHPRIRAVKDAKGDLFEAMSVMSRTSLAYYCGVDELALPYLAAGATGVVSVIGNVAGDAMSELISAIRGNDLVRARHIYRSLIPLIDAFGCASGGAVMVKAALVELGVLTHSTTRLPLTGADRPDLARLHEELSALRPTVGA